MKRRRLNLSRLEDKIAPAAPNPPVIIEPFQEGQITGTFDLNMQTDPGLYFDPDGDAWVATQWRIRDVAANQIVWDTGFLNSPPLVLYRTDFADGTFQGPLTGQTELAYDRQYQLQVRYRDANNETSDFAVRNFRTATATAVVPGVGLWQTRPGYVVEPVGSGYRLAVNIAFVPNPGPNPTDPLYYVAELYGTIKVVRKNGSIGIYADNLLDYNPQGPISGSGEQGLTGIAVDPVTGDLFVGMLWDNNAPPGGPNHYPKVERMTSTDGGQTMATRTVLLNMQPETQGQSHQISNISIGPDGKLYVHMGDGFVASTGLNLDQYRGKILRMNLNGTPATDNPFYNASDGINSRDYIYAYGFRNPFGGAWRAANNKLYFVENGNSMDRLSDTVAGASYGWAGSDTAIQNFSKYVWTQSTAPVNIAFVQSQTFGGSQFPPSAIGSAFVSLSGSTYASGPSARAKSIVEFPDLDTLNAQGKLAVPPATLVRYNGTGRASVIGLAAGPDGLYFSDFYEDSGANGPTAAGSNIYRVRYVGDVGGAVPTVAVPASANPNPVTGSATTTLSVLGADDGGEANLTYTWGLLGNPPGPVSFSINGTNAAKTTTATFSANGSYSFYVTIRDQGGQAVISTTTVTVSAIPTGTGTGLAATYFNNIDFTGSTVTRVDPVIDFVWGTGAPDPLIDPDTFSVRWAGKIQPRFSGNYTFYTTTDDGVRLFVNGQLIINQWVDQPATEHAGTITLVGLQLYDIVMEYYENGGNASARLEWKSASQAREVVPATQLYTNATQAPAAPTALTATALSGTQIRLDWTRNDTPPNLADGFAIERSLNATTWVPIATAPSGATSFTANGLNPGTLYHFRVRAFNVPGASGWSNTANATTLPPGAGINFGNGFAGAGSVLTFNGGPSISSNKLVLTTGGGGQARSAFTTAKLDIGAFITTFDFQQRPGTNPMADGMTFTIQGVGPTALGGSGGGLGYATDGFSKAPRIEQSLAVKFDLFSNAGEGTNSTGVYFNGEDPIPNSVPLTGVNLQDSNVIRVTLTYNGSTLTQLVSDLKTGGTFNKSYTGINLPELVGGPTAHIGFTAGTGGLTAIQEVLNWVYTPVLLPAPPGDLAALSSSSNRIDLSWVDASNNETGFRIERSLNPNSGFVAVATTGPNETSFSDTGLTPATVYYYRVRSFNLAGDSAPATASAVTRTLAPSNLTASSGNQTVLLNWAPPNGATSFRVYRSTNPGGPPGTPIATVTDTVFLDTTVTPFVTYYYRVTAVNAGGESAATPEVSARPVAPPDVTAFVINGSNPQRSRVTQVVVRFNTTVNLQPGAVTLTNLNGNPPPGVTTQLQPATVGDVTEVTMTFTGPAVIGGSLPDGRFRVNVTAAAVTETSPLALAMAANRTSELHRLFGDADGNATVNFTDFLSFRTSFGGTYNPGFDWNNDGNVDFTDFLQFRARFGSDI